MNLLVCYLLAFSESMLVKDTKYAPGTTFRIHVLAVVMRLANNKKFTRLLVKYERFIFSTELWCCDDGTVENENLASG